MTPEREQELFERLGGIDSSLRSIDRKVDQINSRVTALEWWKAKVAGMALVVSAFVSYVTNGRH